MTILNANLGGTDAIDGTALPAANWNDTMNGIIDRVPGSITLVSYTVTDVDIVREIAQDIATDNIRFYFKVSTNSDVYIWAESDLIDLTPTEGGTWSAGTADLTKLVDMAGNSPTGTSQQGADDLAYIQVDMSSSKTGYIWARMKIGTDGDYSYARLKTSVNGTDWTTQDTFTTSGGSGFKDHYYVGSSTVTARYIRLSFWQTGSGANCVLSAINLMFSENSGKQTAVADTWYNMSLAPDSTVAGEYQIVVDAAGSGVLKYTIVNDLMYN